jgi:hypothetical protein
MTDLTKIRNDAIAMAAQSWCDPETETIEMDTRLVQAFANRSEKLLIEIKKLRAALEKCKEQRDNASMCYYEQIYGQTKLGLEKFGKDKRDEDQELERILKEDG